MPSRSRTVRSTFARATVLAAALLGCEGPDGPVGPQGPEGPQGAPGADGADGALRIYGDGSAGAKVITSDQELQDPNTQYTDVTIESGTTLYVPSGVTIRCRGTFTNRGTIVVGGSAFGWSTGVGQFYLEPGLSTKAAWSTYFLSGNNTQVRYGGGGGAKMSAGTAATLLDPPREVGGAGGNAYSCGYPNLGGGSLVVAALGAIVNEGTILADGEGSGCGGGNGGGGGGALVLASATSIENSGTFAARGGNGQASGTGQGPGGGGGGGVIHLFAPQITAGTVDVSGGAAGASGAAIGAGHTRSGGAGGGASAGDGGAGGDVQTDGSFTDAEPGEAGLAFETAADPTGALL